MNQHITIRQIGLEEAPIVQAIFERSPSYFKNVEGCDVLPHFAARDIADIPKKLDPSYEKCFCLAEMDGEPIGVIDLHVHHPAEGIVYIGLLLILDDHHLNGLGRKVFQAAEKFMASRWKIKTIRLGVSESNNVEPFWSKLGFSRNGHTYAWKGENRTTNVFEMEKILLNK